MPTPRSAWSATSPRSVLAHRITVKPELWMTEASGRRVVDAVLGEVATPATLEHRGGP